MTKRAISLLVLAPLLIGAVFYNTPTLELVCDPYDREISAFEVQIDADPAFPAPMSVVDERGWPAGEMPSALIHTAVAALPDGTYNLRARARSEALVWSDWSETLVVTKDWTPPPPPTGCALLRGE